MKSRVKEKSSSRIRAVGGVTLKSDSKQSLNPFAALRPVRQIKWTCINAGPFKLIEKRLGLLFAGWDKRTCLRQRKDILLWPNSSK